MSTTVRINRKGRIQKFIRERYLRDDISCGSAACTECKLSPELQSLSSTPSASGKYLILDSASILQQFDLLESRTGLFDNIIILQTVLEEVKNQQLRAYHRLRKLISNADSSLSNEIQAAVQSFRGLKSQADIEAEAQQKPVRFTVFHNEHHRLCWSERRADESIESHKNRLIIAACRFLAMHWKSKNISVHLITDSKTLLDAAGVENQHFTSQNTSQMSDETQLFSYSTCSDFGQLHFFSLLNLIAVQFVRIYLNRSIAV